jgi:hypothetical protein
MPKYLLLVTKMYGLYKVPGKNLSDVKDQLLSLKIQEHTRNFEIFFVFGDFNHDLNNIEEKQNRFEIY